MIPTLQLIFDSLSRPVASTSGHHRFSVAPIPDHLACFVGKDFEGKACVLVDSGEPEVRQQAPIRLESLEVLFGIPSLVHSRDGDRQGNFTIIRCRKENPEITSYFLSVCGAVLHLLGRPPGRAEIANAVNRLAFIFRKLQAPPIRSLNGLFGELFLIWQSRNPRFALAAWRAEQTSRFDFSAGNVRLDVKTTAGRVRAHSFSFDQCNPPSGTLAVLGSLFVERASGGIALRQIMYEIEEQCAAELDLVVRLHDVIAETLGAALQEGLNVRFDVRLAETTLEFYDLREIPAIRSSPPAGVTDIHFRSDLSTIGPADIRGMIWRDPALAELLPPIHTI